MEEDKSSKLKIAIIGGCGNSPPSGIMKALQERDYDVTLIESVDDLPHDMVLLAGLSEVHENVIVIEDEREQLARKIQRMEVHTYESFERVCSLPLPTKPPAFKRRHYKKG